MNGQVLNAFSGQLPPVLGGVINFGDIALTPGTPNLWTTASDGNWNTPTRWSENVVPGLSHHAIIEATGSYTVTPDVDPTLSSLAIGADGATLLGADRTLTVNNIAKVSAGTLGWRNSTLFPLASLS